MSAVLGGVLLAVRIAAVLLGVVALLVPKRMTCVVVAPASVRMVSLYWVW